MAKTKKKTSAKSTGKAKGAASKAKPARNKAAVTRKPKAGAGYRPKSVAGSKPKSAKKAVKHKAARPPAKRKASSPPVRRRAAKAPAKPVARDSALAVTAAAAEVSRSRAGELQKKVDTIKDLIKALSANLTNTPADDDVLNPNIDSLRNEQRVVEGEIAAAQTGTLDPPDDAEVVALEKAVAAAEETIRQSGSVNELINAAAALIKTLKN